MQGKYSETCNNYLLDYDDDDIMVNILDTDL